MNDFISELLGSNRWRQFDGYVRTIRGIGGKMDALDLGFRCDEAIAELRTIEDAARKARLMLLGEQE
jgi:hypothetical protein